MFFYAFLLVHLAGAVCLPGTFSAHNATERVADECEPCPRHTYNDVYAATTCWRCPVAAYTPTTGATACWPCGEINESYALQDPAACEPFSRPSYSNVIQIGLGMLLFLAVLALAVLLFRRHRHVIALYQRMHLQQAAHDLHFKGLTHMKRGGDTPDIEMELRSDLGDAEFVPEIDQKTQTA